MVPKISFYPQILDLDYENLIFSMQKIFKFWICVENEWNMVRTIWKRFQNAETSYLWFYIFWVPLCVPWFKWWALKNGKNANFDKFVYVFHIKIHACGLPQWYPKFYHVKVWIFSFIKTCQQEFYDNLNHSEMYLNIYQIIYEFT